MLVFIKRNYSKEHRREFIEECFVRYLDFEGKDKAPSPTEASGKNGKPYFEGHPEIRFSLSHSGDVAMLAMSDSEVGCDIEKIKDVDYEAMAKRWFTGGEVAACDSKENYFSVWTKKEAFLKYTADGIGGLTKIDVTLPIEYEGEKIELTSVDFIEGYKGAIASVPQEIVFTDVE